MDDFTGASFTEGGLAPDPTPDHYDLLARVYGKLRHELLCYDPRLHDEIAAVVKKK
jgi:hypothetical protein